MIVNPFVATDPQSLFGTTAAIGLSTAVAVGLVRYRSAIQNRLRAIDESTFFGKKSMRDPFRLVRGKQTEAGSRALSDKINLVALNPDFVEAYSNKWKLTSLGDYLSTLRPQMVGSNEVLPDWIQRELQAALAAALLRSLGPQFGAAVLPAAGSVTSSPIQKVAGGLASYMSGSILGAKDKSRDSAALPLSVFGLTYVAELNYQRLLRHRKEQDEDKAPEEQESGNGDSTESNSLQWLRDGEVGFEPNFGKTFLPLDKSKLEDCEDTTDPTNGAPLVPNRFVLGKDWHRAIQGMEDILVATEACKWKDTPMESDDEGTPLVDHKYDPLSRAMKEPQPIDERLLPDLHLGWGSAQCTHTQRQILENRLLAVLLNKLGANYDMTAPSDRELFRVVLEDGREITKPTDLVQALIDMGHTVETCVRTHVTTFGVALCLKEEDNSWSSVPLAFFMSNGYTDANGNEAYASLPHSGLNFEIRGPLLSKGSIQHFIAIDGLCGWHSNHNAEVPWLEDIDCSPVFTGEKAIESVRLAALEAVVLNTVATQNALPFGGYGLTGVCNDSAARIEYAMTDETHVYPLTFNGRFAMFNIRVCQALKRKLEESGPSMAPEVEALQRLVTTIGQLPSDVNSLPSEAVDQCRRQLHTLPKALPFALMKRTENIISSIQDELSKMRI